MQNPKIIFFDIDDTLYRKYTDTLRPSVFDAVRALKAKGIIAAIATGRAYVAVPEKVREVVAAADMELLLTINGQFIRYRGDVLEQNPMDKDKIEKICAYLDSRSVPYAFVADDQIVVSEAAPVVTESMSHIFSGYTVDKAFFHFHDVFQMLAFYDAGREQEIAEKMALYDCKTVRWHQSSVDILNTQGSKASGIRTAVKCLGIDMSEVMAFGDGLNDIEMLQTVGFGVAMGNGHPEVKAVADYICPTVEEDGVYNGLKALGVI